MYLASISRHRDGLAPSGGPVDRWVGGSVGWWVGGPVDTEQARCDKVLERRLVLMVIITSWRA